MAEIGGFVVVLKSPSGVQVVPKWSTSDLSLSYLISSKRLLFENMAYDAVIMTGPFSTEPGCTRLYLAVPGSAISGLDWVGNL